MRQYCYLCIGVQHSFESACMFSCDLISLLGFFFCRRRYSHRLPRLIEPIPLDVDFHRVFQ